MLKEGKSDMQIIQNSHASVSQFGQWDCSGNKPRCSERQNWSRYFWKK